MLMHILEGLAVWTTGAFVTFRTWVWKYPPQLDRFEKWRVQFWGDKNWPFMINPIATEEIDTIAYLCFFIWPAVDILVGIKWIAVGISRGVHKTLTVGMNMALPSEVKKHMQSKRIL